MQPPAHCPQSAILLLPVSSALPANVPFTEQEVGTQEAHASSSHSSGGTPGKGTGYSPRAQALEEWRDIDCLMQNKDCIYLFNFIIIL